jgi:hypothetical protein
MSRGYRESRLLIFSSSKAMIADISLLPDYLLVLVCGALFIKGKRNPNIEDIDIKTKPTV